ncbi:MAG: hypothetical protein AAGB46_13835 [Verrucomicrobiota bacterium]
MEDEDDDGRWGGALFWGLENREVGVLSGGVEILYLAVALVLSVYVVSRFVGGSTEAMLKQYEVMEKRYGLKQKTSHSKWGAGIGEHHSLAGEFNGYSVSLYDHFAKTSKSKRTWTSLTFEVLFVGELEFVLKVKEGEGGAVYEVPDRFEKSSLGEDLDARYEFFSNDESVNRVLREERIAYRLETFSKAEDPGCFRLSKGFLEYRESGRLTKEAERVRYQQAIVLLAELADSLSVFCAKGHHGSKDLEANEWNGPRL